MSVSSRLPTSKVPSSTVLLLLVRLLLVDASHRQVIVPGDILIGGLFPIHEGSRNASGSSLCGRIKADQGVQRMVVCCFWGFYLGLCLSRWPCSLLWSKWIKVLGCCQAFIWALKFWKLGNGGQCIGYVHENSSHSVRLKRMPWNKACNS